MSTSPFALSPACSVVALLGLLLACSDASQSAPSTAAAQAPTKPPVQHTAAELAKATPAGKVMLDYLDTHVALAADDATSARARYAQLRDDASVAGAVSDDALRKRIVDAARTGASAKDLAAARVAFATLSTAVIDWMHAQPNPLAEKLHVAFCPMAFGSGAKWLQASDTIANPYYGSEMLTCGSIDAALPAGQKL